jgi:hypothetical protein
MRAFTHVTYLSRTCWSFTSRCLPVTRHVPVIPAGVITHCRCPVGPVPSCRGHNCPHYCSITATLWIRSRDVSRDDGPDSCCALPRAPGHLLWLVTSAMRGRVAVTQRLLNTLMSVAKYYCHFLILNTSAVVPVTSQYSYIMRGGGGCVTKRWMKKHVRFAESRISPGNRSAGVILMHYNNTLKRLKRLGIFICTAVGANCWTNDVKMSCFVLRYQPVYSHFLIW